MWFSWTKTTTWSTAAVIGQGSRRNPPIARKRHKNIGPRRDRSRGKAAFALKGGALAAVQLLVVLGALFALILQRQPRHERIPRNELWWAACGRSRMPRQRRSQARGRGCLLTVGAAVLCVL